MGNPLLGLLETSERLEDRDEASPGTALGLGLAEQPNLVGGIPVHGKDL